MSSPIHAPEHLELSWTLSCTVLVFLMQAGFALLEGGVVRTKNSINVAVKNLLDCVISISIFAVVGFGLMFGASVSGVIGTPGSIDFLSDSSLTAFFLFQLVFCSTATTILSGAVAERTKLSTFLIAVVCVSGFVYPMTGHWCWGGVLPGSGAGWLAALGFHDFAGATVVHVVGGFSALAAAQVIGPRRHVPAAQATSGHSLVLAVLGCLLIWVGWWGFNGGSELGMTDRVPLILLNTQVGAVAGGLTATGICYWQRQRIEVFPLTIGVIAGLVSVTAGCDVFHPAIAAFVGSAGAAFAWAADHRLRQLGIDDVVSAFPVHGVAGLWGTFAVTLGFEVSSLSAAIAHSLIQLLGAIVVAATAYLSVRITLLLASRRMPLRVSEYDEIRGLNISEHGATNEVLDLVLEMNAQREEGDFSRSVTVEPHTEAGQIAEQYNRVIERVKEEIESHQETNDWLKSDRLRLKSVLENVDVGIYQLDASFNFTEVNPQLLQTFGYRTATELTQRTTGDIPPWLSGTEHESLFRDAIRDGNAVRDLETQVQRNDGTEIWVLESLIPILDDNDQLVTWLGTVNDVTERKQAMLAEVEIAQAKSEAKGEFLANMSHEIRTPLNGVIGALDLIAGCQQKEQQDHYLSIARSSADTLLALINDVLDFSKIEAGHMELEAIEFDLRDVVEGTSEQFAIRAHSQGLELNCDVAPDIPAMVVGDPERLRQVLINLMGNAIKFTRHGEINLRIQSDGRRIHFAVEDTGIGMNGEQCDRMFEAFTQADASTTREYGGTGLGLSISNKLVQLMGGQLQVRSTPDQGSTFFFAVEMPVASSQRTPDLRLDDLLKDHPGLRVLIVDDNATNCEILKTQLHRWGFRPDICQSSELAVERLLIADRHDSPFSLVLLDYCMPVMDGADVARSIRRLPQFDSLPIIMLSSNHELMSRKQRESCGINIAMSKPVRQSRLYDSIVDVLKERFPEQPATLTHHTPAQADQRPVDTPSTNDAVRENLLQQLKAPTPPAVNSPVTSDFLSSEQTTIDAPLPQSYPVSESANSERIDVLVAEDNNVNQLVARQMLMSLGFTTSIVENGMEAIEQLRTTTFQLVLMDGHMPIMDGLEATTRIRKMQKAAELPLNTDTKIIALTANVSSDARDQFIKAGVDDFLSKPVTLKRLKSALAEYKVSHVEEQGPKTASLERPPAIVTSPASETPSKITIDSVTSKHHSGSTSVAVSQPKTAQSTPSAELYNDKEFQRRCGGDESFKRQVLSLMQSSLPNTLNELQTLVARADFEQTAAIAHRLKGAAGDSSLPAVRDAAASVEEAAQCEHSIHIQQAVVELNQSIRETLDYLERHLTEQI